MSIRRIHHMLIGTGLIFSIFAIAGAKADETTVSPPPVQEEQSPPPETAPTPEAGEVQERGLAPRIPLGAMPQLQRVGPTPSLTAVANGFALRHKSVTTLLIVAPNLPVTETVEISIGYYSPAGTKRITQSYVRGTGNRFLYNDLEGDGKPRQMRIDISLLEPNPGGQPYTFAFSMHVNLDPLYDVTISPLKFDLISNCDTAGDSEVGLNWCSPHELAPQRYNFSTRAGRRNTIGQFAWSRAEVSASNNLRRERVANFADIDHPLVGGAHGFESAGSCGGLTNLVPGKTQTVKGNRKAANGSCEAYFEYTITYTLRWYPHL
jgi:hypothetical protein